MGLFRSAAVDLAKLFESEQIANLLIEEIFGSSKQQGKWAFSAAKLDLANASKTRRRYVYLPTTQFRRGVKINPRLRRAEDKKLFTREFGGAELTFEFSVERTVPHGADKNEAAFLVAAARLIRGLGASVNRGAGRCLIRLKQVEGVKETCSQAELLQHFANLVKYQAEEKVSLPRAILLLLRPPYLTCTFEFLHKPWSH